MWRHQMETFSALLAICAGNSPVPVNSPHKGQWHGAFMFSLICVWINGWVNNREAGDLRRHRAHYDVTVMNYPLEELSNIFTFCFISISKHRFPHITGCIIKRTIPQGPILQTGFCETSIRIMPWISNYVNVKEWDVIHTLTPTVAYLNRRWN